MPRLFVACSIFLSVLFSGLTVSAADEAQWRAGVASMSITPGAPMWMGGYASRKTPAEGTLSELFAKAVALEAGDNRLVIVTTDLIGIPRSLAVNVARQVEQKFGLPRRSLLLNASHTHCGPEVRPERKYFFGIADEHAARISTYVSTLETSLVELVGAALNDLRPATLAVSQSSAPFAKNRRFPTENGFINKRYDDGLTDHDVPVLQVFAADGTRRAILFGYACHNTTTPIMQFNGDYAGFAQSDIEKDFPGVTALFVQGAGGDQNPYPRGKIELARKHGRALADAVKRAVDQKRKQIAPELKSAFEEVTLEFAPLPPRAKYEADLKSKNIYHRRKAAFILGKLDRNEPIELTYPCPVQAVRFGREVLLVAVGGEVVVDYARKIKQEFAGPLVWFAGYSNDVFGYLPSQRVLKEGGYEAGRAMLYGPLPGPFSNTTEQRVMQGVRRTVAEVGFKTKTAK